MEIMTQQRGTEYYCLSFHMKEQLQMKRIDEKSVVRGDEKELLSISSDNSLSGQVLYDSFLDSISPSEEAEINVLGEELSKKKDQIICNRFKDLIGEICKAINSSNNKGEAGESKETDAFVPLK